MEREREGRVRNEPGRTELCLSTLRIGFQARRINRLDIFAPSRDQRSLNANLAALSEKCERSVYMELCFNEMKQVAFTRSNVFGKMPGRLLIFRESLDMFPCASQCYLRELCNV